MSRFRGILTFGHTKLVCKSFRKASRVIRNTRTKELVGFVCRVSYSALGEGEAADHQQPRDHAWDIWNSFTTPGID